MEELTLIKIYADGRTEPSLEPGIEILLIQDGTVTVGKLFYEDGNTGSIFIDHPKNQEELNKRAKKIVKERKPKFLKNKNALTVTCPTEIKSAMIW